MTPDEREGARSRIAQQRPEAEFDRRAPGLGCSRIHQLPEAPPDSLGPRRPPGDDDRDLHGGVVTGEPEHAHPEATECGEEVVDDPHVVAKSAPKVSVRRRQERPQRGRLLTDPDKTELANDGPSLS